MRFCVNLYFLLNTKMSRLLPRIWVTCRSRCFWCVYSSSQSCDPRSAIHAQHYRKNLCRWHEEECCNVSRAIKVIFMIISSTFGSGLAFALLNNDDVDYLKRLILDFKTWPIWNWACFVCLLSLSLLVSDCCTTFPNKEGLTKQTSSLGLQTLLVHRWRHSFPRLIRTKALGLEGNVA